MPYADLHVHTTRSDGQLDRAEVPAAAAVAGVSVVAITDHDRLQPVEEPTSRVDGVTIVNGIELRVECSDGQAVDLLGYAIRPTGDLESRCEAIQRNRVERGRAIVDRVQDRLGVDLDVAIETGVGRPNVARAIDEHPDTAYDYEGAFEHLIGNDGPCYVPREIPSFDEGRRLLADASSIVSLAHPLRYGNPESALELAADLDAVELAYPYGREVDRTAVERAIERHGLAATGGSDAHDDRLGLAGLNREEYATLGFPEPTGRVDR